MCDILLHVTFLFFFLIVVVVCMCVCVLSPLANGGATLSLFCTCTVFRLNMDLDTAALNGGVVVAHMLADDEETFTRNTSLVSDFVVRDMRVTVDCAPMCAPNARREMADEIYKEAGCCGDVKLVGETIHVSSCFGSHVFKRRIQIKKGVTSSKRGMAMLKTFYNSGCIRFGEIELCKCQD
jgi:hypothetical protein